MRDGGENRAPALVDIVREYAQLQDELVRALASMAGGPLKVEELFSWPQSGELRLRECRWSFRRHGHGYAFQNLATGTLVDAHEHLDAPSCPVDAWRLQQYLESKGVPTVGVGARALPADDFSELNNALRRLAEDGFLQVTGHGRDGEPLHYSVRNA